ncbi:RNA recognition motif. (a.k.a. RRM, RBD, or RNP domain) [Mucilaginibacter lappiensis]|uniref:RNA recognition motif-containing protein n=1 Tax=Mucilaginibacter lappiensis TaxID=354630 RepID=A0ABR6PFY4_9SPHI|nr:RNA-binding protein [Mucilaginibacter lappiensis]MBB6108672.1 RNA recognition motif-containing protein [Mucilaginibacter lappiensis]SIQ28396.1 RNA recognition motif. (a.k.a. RRM, RBD, or RNP domain) [Mucilaginibacter lappiensis]
MIKIFIGGFPLEFTEMELAQLVSPYGEVCTIKIVRNKATRKCKGYAFIEMSSQLAAESAMAALDGTMIGDRELSVCYVTEKSLAPAKSRHAPVYRKVEKTGEPQKKKRPRRPV